MLRGSDERSELDGLPVSLAELFGFFRALPFVHFTKHLPAISALVPILKRDFAIQFNLAYLLLSALPDCASILRLTREASEVLGKLVFPDSPAWTAVAEPAGFSYSFREIDKITEILLADKKSAYWRLVEFTRRAVDIHNRAILGNGCSVTLQTVTRAHVVPHLSLANTLLPALATVFNDEYKSNRMDSNLNLFNVVSRAINAMVPDDALAVAPICFARSDMALKRIFMESDFDIFKFTEKIFIESLKKANPPKRSCCCGRRFTRADGHPTMKRRRPSIQSWCSCSSSTADFRIVPTRLRRCWHVSGISGLSSALPR
jgi:hypothetical protein